MTIVRIRGIKRYFEKKTGRWYCYHRKTGTPINAEFGSPEFFAEVARADRAAAPAAAARAGSLGLLMRAYQASAHFAELKPRTQADYRKVISFFGTIDDLALHEIERTFVARLRDRVFQKRGRAFANYTLAVLSILCEFAIERGEMKDNPVRGVRKIRRPKDAARANRPWSKAEREIAISHAPAHLRVALTLGRWTGLREGDVIAAPRTCYDGKTIRLRTRKRGVLAAMPVAPALKRELDALDHNAITLLANSYGRPWTANGFRASLFKYLRALERKGMVGSGLTFHGLRHSLAGDLAELGYDRRTIADMLGQDDERMAAHYSREADLSHKLTGVVHHLVRANKNRTKTSRKTDRSV